MTFHATTILCVRHGGRVVMVGDGQVSVGQTIMKHNARKVRRLHNDAVVSGFAGSTADALTLFEKFEGKLQEFNGNLRRAAVEMAKDWRTDRVLRRLEAMLIVADRESSLLISGMGDVIEPDDGLLAIGSGGNFALAAARAMVRRAPEMSAREIAEEAMKIAAELCVYTNDRFIIEEL
ncbi:MAG TPA: ATP-dependent protease subunit HslV [Candidatus Binataceae bacterium]|nr:ATP-dependent protease subunit HslV [Candidatus Binataceae bacterium]HVA69115.1 ATP-dependent protease subunit HslV [Candidatus Binataceae bacterium]